ncbi:MAG TPA: hypothetical protein VFH51_09685, partial [Myxococcota bacterium]|nr:hypothetical protein [Myxococcota bacterium]
VALDSPQGMERPPPPGAWNVRPVALHIVPHCALKEILHASERTGSVSGTVTVDAQRPRRFHVGQEAIEVADDDGTRIVAATKRCLLDII